MFGISGTELLIIGVFAFLIFGPDKIPEVMRTVTKAIDTFKKTQDDVERIIKEEMNAIDPTMGDTILGAKSALDASLRPPTATKPAVDPSTGTFGADEADEEDEE